MASAFISALLWGLCISAFLILGHVFGMMAANWSRDVFDFNQQCIYENEYDFVNGDFSDALYASSWVSLILAAFLYAAIIVGSLTKKKSPVVCVTCLYVISWIVWAVLLLYVILFFSYIYFDKTYLVHSCGGLAEVRNIWWISIAGLGMSLFALIGVCCFSCTGSTTAS